MSESLFEIYQNGLSLSNMMLDINTHIKNKDVSDGEILSSLITVQFLAKELSRQIIRASSPEFKELALALSMVSNIRNDSAKYMLEAAETSDVPLCDRLLPLISESELDETDLNAIIDEYHNKCH